MSRARDIANLIGGATPDIILKTSDGAILELQTSDTTVTDGSVLGAINFTAPDEASGTDALLVGAVIQAEAEGTFAADNNATSIVFKTGASEAAATKMTINSKGSVGFGVDDGDVTSDGTAARKYVAIIGTGNRGRLNLGSTAVNGADSGVLSFVNGANELGNINMETNSGVQNAGKMYITSTDLLTVNSAGGVVFNDNSANVDFRVESNGNANMLFVDGGNDVVSIGGAVSETTDTLQVTNAGSSGPTNTRFVNTNADASGVRLDFMKNTSSPADGDGVVALNFLGTDSSGNAENYANINVYMEDVTSGTEDGSLVISTIVAGTNRNRLDFLPAETVFNEAGVGGINFRIESDTNENMFLIDSGDNTIAIGTTVTSLAVQNTQTGVNFTHVGRIFTCATDHHDLNVQDDGEIIRFRSAANNEGNINVSGSTVALTGFSGRHESSGVATDTVVGTVVSTIDELDIYAEGSGPKAGQIRYDHAKIKVSDTAGDKRVYGVIANFDEYNNPIVAALGIAPVRVTGSCAGGDLLESNGDGTAKVQSDDIIRSKTIGKVTVGNNGGNSFILSGTNESSADAGSKILLEDGDSLLTEVLNAQLTSCVMYCG